MFQKKGFTLIELLVVIAIIALLMAILMPALQRVKKQSKAVSCLAQLKQWALYFSLYAGDHGGYLMEGYNGRNDGNDASNRWVRALGSYYKWDDEFTCCPEATKPWFLKNGTSNNLRGTYLGLYLSMGLLWAGY